MRLWERIAIRGNREVYYYDTKQSFEAEEFASRLYDLICMEQENGKTAGVVFPVSYTHLTLPTKA